MENLNIENMPKIKDYWAIYKELKEVNQPKKSFKIKPFNFLQDKPCIMRYFRENKKSIIESINFAYFPSDEPYLISCFVSDSIYFVHINARSKEKIPGAFEDFNDYENYLNIYATFAVLHNQNFQISTLNDSRLICAERLMKFSDIVYYDDNFKLNLSPYLEDKLLQNTFLYGYDFLFALFSKSEELDIKFVKRYLKLEDSTIIKLYEKFYKKMILENFIKG